MILSRPSERHGGRDFIAPSVAKSKTMIEIRLYGSLRRFARDSAVTAESIAWVPAEPGDTVAAVLRRLGIDPEGEVGNIFVNGRYSFTARQRAVEDGDRLGVFPRNMSLLYV